MYESEKDGGEKLKRYWESIKAKGYLKNICGSL
jgi:hypothetical protein